MMTYLTVLSVSSSVRYCFLHGWRGLPEHLPSDLDTVVAPEDLPKLEYALLKTEGARLVQLLQHEATCYYFVLAVNDGASIRWLPVDAAIDYRRNGRVWYSADELLKGRRQSNGLWVASPEVEFEYSLVKKILKGSVPAHTRERMQELMAELADKAGALAAGLLGERWGLKLISWIRAGDWQQLQANLKRLRRTLVWQRFKQDPLNPLRYWLPELRRVWRRWRYPTGLFVAALGPDGAGKSTVIRNLQEQLKGAFRRTTALHFSAALFRKGDAKPVTNPHGKPPRSWLASLAKLGFYVLEYTLGYWFKVRPLLARSTLVLFDRYYDDLLVDPARYRYGGPSRLARWLWSLVPRPHLVLMLDVPEEELLKRKSEVVLDELRRLRKGYCELASDLPNAVRLDGSTPPEVVACNARDVVLEYLHARYLRRRHIWFGKPGSEALEWVATALDAKLTNAENKPTFGHLALPDGRGYLLPLVSRRARVSALSLYQPQRRGAKAFKRLLSTALTLGVVRPLLLKVHLCHLQNLEDLLKQVFHRHDFTLAVSLGTPSHHRKPVVQVLSSEGQVLGYVKVGWNEATKGLVQHEAETLSHLKHCARGLHLPDVKFAGGWQERFLCVQSGPPSGATETTHTLTPVYVVALNDLSDINRVERPLEKSDFWKRVLARLERVRNAYYHEVLQRGMDAACEAFEGQPLAFHQSHGDFAPWNALQVDGRLFLYDWEYASAEAPAGYDLFHFTVQINWLVKRQSPAVAYRAVLQRMSAQGAEAYWKHLGIKPESALFLLYLLDRVTSFVIEDPKGSERALFLAKLIDLFVVGAL